MVSMSTEDNAYIQRVLEGDLRAYTPLVNKYHGYVLALVRRTCKHSAEAEELAQDVFIKAYEHLKSFKGTAAFSTWLYRIAFNTAVSHARRRRYFWQSINQSQAGLVATEDEEEREEGLQRESRYVLLEKAVAGLPSEEQMLLSLFYHQDMKMEEIAYICGLSQSNAKVKIHRIRKKLEQILTEESQNANT